MKALENRHPSLSVVSFYLHVDFLMSQVLKRSKNICDTLIDPLPPQCVTWRYCRKLSPPLRVSRLIWTALNIFTAYIEGNLYMYVRSYSTLQSIYEILAECDFKSLLNKSVKFHGDTIYFSHEKKAEKRRGRRYY